MTDASDFASDGIAHNAGDEVVHGAWVGPAIGSAILTIAWAVYLVPLLMGILSIAG